MTARKKTEPDEVTVEERAAVPGEGPLPPADESLYADDAVELEAEEVTHTVERPGGLLVAYIKGADGVVRREYVDAGALEVQDGDVEVDGEEQDA